MWEKKAPRHQGIEAARGNKARRDEETESEPGRVASVHVRNGLAARRAADGVWCASANRVDTTRLAGVATLPAAEHSAGAFLFGWVHREVRLLPTLASLCSSTDADISQMPLEFRLPVVHCSC